MTFSRTIEWRSSGHTHATPATRRRWVSGRQCPRRSALDTFVPRPPVLGPGCPRTGAYVPAVPLLPSPRLLVALLLIGALSLSACGGQGADPVRIEAADAGRAGATEAARPPEGDRRTTVFLDAGHGGRDPGWGSS